LQIIIIILILLFGLINLQANIFIQGQIQKITPTEVFAEAINLQSEIDSIKIHFQIDRKVTAYRFINGNFKPKHVWQLAYMLNVKINMFRLKYGLPRIEEVGIEPVLNVNPNMPYGMLRRLITEVKIIKRFLNIKDEVTYDQHISGKNPTDVFNKLLYISKNLDILNEMEIDPNAVFSQVMRVYQDVSIVLKALNIKDITLPLNKIENIEPKDSFIQVLKLIKEIQRIQRTADIQRTNFNSLKKELITSEDVFIGIQMANAEFQTIKAYLGLIHEVSPPAKFYYNKTASDVNQMINWITKRVQLISHLDTK